MDADLFLICENLRESAPGFVSQSADALQYHNRASEPDFFRVVVRLLSIVAALMIAGA